MMWKKFIVSVMLVAGFCPSAVDATPLTDDRPVVTVALIDTFSPTFYIETYAPTLEHLIATLPQYQFNVVEIDYHRIEEDIQKHRPAFIVTSASGFASIIGQFGAHQIATRRPKGSAGVSRTVASTFVVRSDSAIHTLAEAKGSKVAVSSTGSFDGWLIAKGHLIEQFGEERPFFTKIISTDYGIPDVAMMVKMGLADVGVLRTCEYESLVRMKQIEPHTFRILNDISGQKGCVRSTEQYPDVVFSSLPHNEPDVTKNVTLALLSMSDKDRDFTWTIANDFLPTYNLLKTLQIGPYAPQPWSAAFVWKTYRTEILLILVLILAVVFHIVSINRLVRRRTAELYEAVRKTQHFHREVQQIRSQLLQIERLSIVSQLSSMFAHEIKQPIMNISLYGAALRMLLEKKGALTEQADDLIAKLQREVDRSSQIVEHVRRYAKKTESRKEPCHLGKITGDVVQSFKSSVPMQLSISSDPTVNADPFELQYIIANFIKNAQSAVASSEHPSVEISVEEKEGKALVSVIDNGPAIPDEVFDRLGHVKMSEKPDGLGFGLSIAVTLAEKMGGHIEFERCVPSGIRATLVLRRLA